MPPAVTVHYVGFHPRLILEGFDRVRLSYPIERVYLLYDSKPARYGAVSRHNVQKIQQVLSFFKPVLVKVNPLSYASVAAALYAILKSEEGKIVFVDLTDMPPYMAATVAIISSLFPNSRLYAARPEQSGEFIPDPETPEFTEFLERKDNLTLQDICLIEKPRARVELLDEESKEVSILTTLYVRNGSAESISELIKWLGKEPSQAVVRATYSRIVESMEERGLLEREQEGRAKRIKLTQLGWALAEAYVKLGLMKSSPKPPAARELSAPEIAL
ncbi:MAG: hypothetical protein QXS92_00080 [Thermofilum sp.]